MNGDVAMIYLELLDVALIATKGCVVEATETGIAVIRTFHGMGRRESKKSRYFKDKPARRNAYKIKPKCLKKTNKIFLKIP